MSFVVSCECGKQYRVADDQMGKKSKCKGCGAVLRLVPDEGEAAPPPPPADDAAGDDPFASIDWEAAAAMEKSAAVDHSAARPGGAPPPPVPVSSGGGPKQKVCPSCGAVISAFAMRCEHCGAGVAPGMAGAGLTPAKGGKNKVVVAGGDDSDLTPVDWLLCIFCSGIACILGIVYMVQGKPKGGKMIGIAFLMNIIGGAVARFIAASMHSGT